MSRVIHVKGKVFIENRKIAIDVIQEAKNGIHFNNNQFLFKKYDAYDQISRSEKVRQMERVEQEYSRRNDIYLREIEEKNKIRRDRGIKNQERLVALQKKKEKLEEVTRQAQLEADRMVKLEADRMVKLEADRMARLEMERLKIEEERKAVELERERIQKEEEQRIIKEKKERERIEKEKIIMREEKADLIIANAKKQGYKIKKELRKDNTIKLVLQKRIY